MTASVPQLSYRLRSELGAAEEEQRRQLWEIDTLRSPNATPLSTCPQRVTRLQNSDCSQLCASEKKRGSEMRLGSRRMLQTALALA